MQFNTHLSPVASYSKQEQFLTPTRSDVDADGHLCLPIKSKNMDRKRSSSKKRFGWIHGNSPRNACTEKTNHKNQENNYLTPEQRGRDLTDATNFSRFQDIHNAPVKRPLGPDSTEKSKRRDFFDPENVKVSAFSLEFVDSDEEDQKAAMKEIRKDYSGFTAKIMNVNIGSSLIPTSSVSMRM